MAALSDFEDALSKMLADLMKGFDDLFPLTPQPVPPAFRATPQADPVKSPVSGFAASRAHLAPHQPGCQCGAITCRLARGESFIPPAYRTLEEREAGQLLVTKHATIINVPGELLMDYGVIPGTRPKPPPLPWRWRLRNRISDWREHAARSAYRIIAGEWPDGGEDDW